MADTSTRRKRSVSIQLTYHGASISFGFTAEEAVPVNEIEQMVDTILRREGWASMPQPSASTNGTNGAKRKAEWVDPEYDNNGDPVCPVHRKPLKQGTYGSYCPSKAKEGEVSNDKGYCALKFKE